MVNILSAVSIIGSILLTPFLVLLVCIIFLASIGKSIGVRRLYVHVLLKVFEYGRKDIESAQRKNNLNDQNEDDEEDEGYSEKIAPIDKKISIKPVNGALPVNGYIKNNGNSLISRDDKLILVPEPPVSGNGNKSGNEEEEEEEVKDNKEKYKDFDLSNCFEYIKVGVEAIIEDQVTSRFEAEELKNWNLLIRTNRGYEFISWKLTIIWVIGFFIRYFFLFPLRVIICFVGLMWLLVSTCLIGVLPENAVKRWINRKAYIIAFRIMSRCLSGVIRIHDKHLRPARGSICVANHTSPIDVLILSTDNCYSLVSLHLVTNNLVEELGIFLYVNVLVLCASIIHCLLIYVQRTESGSLRPKTKFKYLFVPTDFRFKNWIKYCVQFDKNLVNELIKNNILWPYKLLFHFTARWA